MWCWQDQQKGMLGGPAEEEERREDQQQRAQSRRVSLIAPEHSRPRVSGQQWSPSSDTQAEWHSLPFASHSLRVRPLSILQGC